MLVGIAAVPNPRVGLLDHEQAGLAISFNQIERLPIQMVRIGIATGSDLWAVKRDHHGSGSGYFGYAFELFRLVTSFSNTTLSPQSFGAHLPWHGLGTCRWHPWYATRAPLEAHSSPKSKTEPFESLLRVGPGSKRSDGAAGREMTRHMIARKSRGLRGRD
ncbi:BQ2448_3525 [Microbotryum intermedium]|uniref:BQ2448_3525 protein n=1 Tax=Microbotryum intermedium TaxID=269621 RepID=A0A238FFI3_9BASI|nr:BQ2448_3525 [Microbotryum intermedium]